VEAAWEQVPTAPHFGLVDPGSYRFACVLRNFELNRPIGLALNDRDPLTDPVADDKIADPPFDEVTPAKLAVDGEIEECQVTEITREFKPGPNGPNLLG